MEQIEIYKNDIKEMLIIWFKDLCKDITISKKIWIHNKTQSYDCYFIRIQRDITNDSTTIMNLRVYKYSDLTKKDSYKSLFEYKGELIYITEEVGMELLNIYITSYYEYIRNSILEESKLHQDLFNKDNKIKDFQNFK